MDITGRLAGTVALVTGGSRGIGAEITRRLAAEGADVGFTYLSGKAGADSVAAGVRSLGRRALAVPADLAEPGAAFSVVDAVADEFGRLDILVNNAGGAFGDTFRHGPLSRLTADDFVEAFRANVVGTLLCSQRAAPIMKQTGGGSIVHISSGAGRFAAPQLMGAYGASKAALNNLTRTMAMEFAPDVRVNAILPGHVDTPRVSANRTPERAAAALLDSASGRLGTPSEIGSAVCFLCAPAGSWVNAVLLDINGGDTRRRD
jgi:NAD(P)-dependent dehydrogenase (short-subunit alcohol dehydrogenase family)